MAKITSKNNEYTVYFDRSKSLYPNKDYQYICSMRFVNNLGVEVLNLKFSEVFAFKLVDNFYEFINTKADTFIINMDTVNTDLANYKMYLSKIPGNIEVSIYKCSKIYPQSDHILTLTLDNNEYDQVTIDTMAYLMYFSYCIDIVDCCSYL